MSRNGVGHRRERDYLADGTLLLRCWGSFHDGDWLNSDRFFYNTRTNIFSTHCKECHTYRSTHDRGLEPLMRLELVRKWIYEIVHICDGYNAAARTLQVPQPTLYRWLGRYTGYEQRWIRRDSVRRIIEVLAALRAGDLEPASRGKNGGRRYKHGCIACGTPLDLYTPACSTCNDRRLKRSLRANQNTTEGRAA